MEVNQAIRVHSLAEKGRQGWVKMLEKPRFSPFIPQPSALSHTCPRLGQKRLPNLIASSSLLFQSSATSVANGSSGFDADNRTSVDNRTVRISSAGDQLPKIQNRY